MTKTVSKLTKLARFLSFFRRKTLPKCGDATKIYCVIKRSFFVKPGQNLSDLAPHVRKQMSYYDNSGEIVQNYLRFQVSIAKKTIKID